MHLKRPLTIIASREQSISHSSILLSNKNKKFLLEQKSSSYLIIDLKATCEKSRVWIVYPL
jgi:hypothetical protein